MKRYRKYRRRHRKVKNFYSGWGSIGNWRKALNKVRLY
jgi:hypothetical protein